jgi:CubicO group peptidase (beta-lactamase class C family)
VTERTNFRLASLTKPFTALAVMLLVSDGRLRLDDRVRDILPNFPAYDRDILIWHLLGHTSGLRPYQAFVRDSRLDSSRTATCSRSCSTPIPSCSRPARPSDTATPDTRFWPWWWRRCREDPSHGSCTTGSSREPAWKPPSPTSPASRWCPTGLSAIRPPRPGFTRPISHTTAVLGDGGIYSSVRDLAAWDRTLDEHRLLDARLQRLAWTPGTLHDGTRTRYGFGWFIDRDATGRSVSHHGETRGFTNTIVKYPGRRLTVVVLTNRRGGAPGEIAATITTLDSFRTALR